MWVLSSYALFTATSYRCGSFFLFMRNTGKKKKSVIECSNKYAFGVKTPQA